MFKYFVYALLSTAMFAQTTAPTSPYNISVGFTPTWYKISVETSSVRILLPQGTIFRFGDSVNNKWSDPTIVNAMPSGTTNPFQLIPYWSNMPFPDPDVGTLKELDVLEQAWPQTFNAYDSVGQPFTISVPALPVPPPPPVNPLGLLLGTCYVNSDGSGTLTITCKPPTP